MVIARLDLKQRLNLYIMKSRTQTALLSRFVSGEYEIVIFIFIHLLRNRTLEPFGMDWEYFKFSPGWSIHLEKYQGGLSEVFVLVRNSTGSPLFRTFFIYLDNRTQTHLNPT